MAPIPQRELLTQIREALKRLRLPEALIQLDRELQNDPLPNDSRLAFLWRILEPQLRVRQERSVQRRIHTARFPTYKTLDDFNFKFQPRLDRERVLEFATLDFLRRGQNLLIVGMSGTGKTHISIAIGHLACVAGYRTLYTTSAAMLAALNASRAFDALDEAIKPYVRAQLLIIDEIGLDLTERDTSRDAQLFYKVVAPRYEAGASTIITSNIPWEEWGKRLGDDIATVAILDRLIHHGHLLTIDGRSYRAAQHSKLNPPREPPNDEKVGD